MNSTQRRTISGTDPRGEPHTQNAHFGPSGKNFTECHPSLPMSAAVALRSTVKDEHGHRQLLPVTTVRMIYPYPAAHRPDLRRLPYFCGMRRYNLCGVFSHAIPARHKTTLARVPIPALATPTYKLRPKRNAGAHTYRRGDIGNQRIVVRVILLDPLI